jgi:hypothetical protein
VDDRAVAERRERARIGPTDLSILDRAEFKYDLARRARPWLLGPNYGFDTVVC